MRPFISGRWKNSSITGESESEAKPGFDLFYNITSSLKLTATVNTDFGESEADERKINLSRYSLFFPEKRAFFLEDAGVFTFASIGPATPGGVPPADADIYPFFSRRIGLLFGQEVPLNAGLKLAGKIGRTDLGMLYVGTDATGLSEEEKFYVGRVRQNFLEQSYIGAIFTDGDALPGQASRTYGADMRLATSHFLGASNLVMDAFALRTEHEQRPSGSDWAYGFSARYPNDRLDAQVVFREIPKDLDPGLGFVQRDNARMFRVATSYNPRPKHLLNLRQMFHHVFYTRFDRLDTGETESWNLFVVPLDWHFMSGDSLHALLDLDHRYEQLFEPFEISPGVLLLPGQYRFTRFESDFASAVKRRLSGRVSVKWGEFWSGSAEEVLTEITYKMPPWFMFSFSAQQTFARLPEGEFTARILTSKINYAASPRLSFSNLLQYDNRSRNLAWQGRIRWTMQPGNDLFFVVNKGWIQEERGDFRFGTADTRVSAKFQFTMRF